MIIVDTDNFSGDYPDEKIIASGIKSKEHALLMADALNQRYGGNDARRYYKVEEDDYKLQLGFTP